MPKIWRLITGAIIACSVGSCGGSNSELVDGNPNLDHGDPADCANFYVQNNSNYKLHIEEENWGPHVSTYETEVSAGAREKVGSACDIGTPHPSEYFTEFSIYADFNDGQSAIYVGIENSDWKFEEPDDTGYSSRTLFISDSGVVVE